MTLKEIVKSREPAMFSHAIAGVLYYTVKVGDKTVMFPIDMNDRDDVGTTAFHSKYRPMTLMRYIRKAMETDSLVIM